MTSFKSTSGRVLRYTSIILSSFAISMASMSTDSYVMASDHDKVVISVVTPFPRDDRLQDGFWLYVENLKEAAPWITFDYRGGPDAIDPLSQGEALANGAVDAVPLPTSYYEHLLPLASGMQLTPLLPAEEREHGVRDFLNQAHEQDLGVHYLGNVTAGIPFQIFLNKPIEEADLSGLTIRASATYVPLVQALNGGVVSMPGGELYTALERGVIDGYGWTSVGVTSLSLHEVTAYEVLPEFYEDTTSLLINLEFWNALDEETTDIMTRVMVSTEAELIDMHSRLVEQERAERTEAGVEIIELIGVERERFLTKTYNSAWEYKIAANPAVEQLRELFANAAEAQ